MFLPVANFHPKRCIRILTLLTLGMCSQSFANTQDTIIRDTVTAPLLDLSSVTADPYELALTQVLAEICPPLLNETQRQRFFNAYNLQMRSFIPAHLDSQAAIRQIGSQHGYRNILQSVRSWTLSYPTNENKALCIEFANSF